MRTLKTSEAAALLNVSPNTLRTWEGRFDFPRPQRTAGGHRVYAHAEVAALRDALLDGLSVSSAVSRARETLQGDTHTLAGALAAFELDRAEAALEAALSMRSVERAVEEVLLPSMAELARRAGTDSAAWAVGNRWAGEWLRRAQRMTPPPVRPGAVLLADATTGERDPEGLRVRALELFCARTGVRVASVPVTSSVGLPGLLRVLRPGAIVVAGAAASDDDVARFAYAVRASAGPLPLALFAREAGDGGTGALRLPASPSAATARMLQELAPDDPAALAAERHRRLTRRPDAPHSSPGTKSAEMQSSLHDLPETSSSSTTPA